MTLLFVIAMSATAAADVIETDGDIATAGVQTLNLGTVCVNTSTPGSVHVWARTSGGPGIGNNKWDNSALLTASVNTPVVAGSSTATGTTISATVPAPPATPPLAGTSAGNQVRLESNWLTLANSIDSAKITAPVQLNAGGTPGSFSGTIQYQLSGTGYVPPSAALGTLARTDTLQFTATVSNTGTCAPPTNNPPTVLTAAADATGNEGSLLSTNGAFTDPDGDTLSFTQLSGVGTVTPGVGGAWSWSYTPSDSAPNADGSGTVVVQADDGEGGTVTDTFNWSASNVAPTADALSATSGFDEGGSSTLSLANPTDASSVDAASLRYSFACDGLDASLAADYASAITTNSASCQFADDGTFTVKGRVYDKDGDGTTYSGSVAVINANPVVAAAMTTTSVDCRTTAGLSLSFTDAGVNDAPWSVHIDWDDPDNPTDTEFNVTAQGTVSPSPTHTYVTPGTYLVDVSVTDKDGGTGTDDDNAITINQTYAIDFLPPFDDSTPSGLIVNKMRNGRVVPVKATLFDECALEAVTDPSTAVTIKISKTSGSGTGDPIEEYADAGESSGGTNAFRFADGFWIHNLDSKALGLVVNNYYRVDVYVDAMKATTDTWGVLQPVK